MGFFSFNSEILSLSGTIKTNRGAKQNVIKQKLTRLSLCPWASPAWASVGAGRGGRGLVWDLPSAPSSTPGQPTGLQTGGRGAGESAPGAQSEPLLLLSFGAPKRRPGHPFSRKKGGAEKHPQLCRSPPFAPVLRSSGRSSLTSRSPRTSIAPCAGHGTKTRGNGNLGPQGGWRIGDPNSRRKVQERGTRPAVSYLRGSCREGRRGSATIPGLNVLPLSPYPSIQLGLLPLASPWKKFRRKRRKKKNQSR